MTTTSLIIETTTTSGKKVQKSVQNINPSATDANLYLLASKLNAVSVRTYETSYRVDKKELGVNQPEG